MSSSPRARRIANEWQYLLELARENPSLLEIKGQRTERGATRFDLLLAQTPAYAARPADNKTLDTHELTFRFPEFYPAVPCEAYLRQLVFHPNIHPHNGFVCLWDRTSPGDSVIEALQQTQRVLTWHLWNPSAEHVMQPEALAIAPEVRPLAYQPLRVPEQLARERAWRVLPRPARQRLSD